MKDLEQMAVYRTKAERYSVAKMCWGGEGGCLIFLTSKVQNTNSEASKLFHRLRSYLLDLGLPDLVPIQAGTPLGLSTCTLSPVNTCSFFVPRSRSLMSV